MIDDTKTFTHMDALDDCRISLEAVDFQERSNE
jgi:hypothetical protein